MSWTPWEKRKERDAEEAMVTKVLQAHQLVGPAIAANHAKGTSNPTNSDFKPLMTLLDKSDSKGS